MLIKIPFLFVAIIYALRFVYIKKTYRLIGAECISSVKQEVSNDYLTTYQYIFCENNIIEQEECALATKLKQKEQKMYKLFIRPNIKKAKRYNKVIVSTVAIILLSLMVVIML